VKPTPPASTAIILPPVRAIIIPLAAVLFMLGIGWFGTGWLSVLASPVPIQSAAPIVTVVHPLTNQQIELQYGANTTLTEPNFYLETRDAFIDEAITFIEVDLTSMELRYFEQGVLVDSAPVLSKGRPGSWWETPAGLYQVESKTPSHFSSFGQVYQPWSMVFQGNFFIHGWPEYADGTPVASEFSGGCVRLATPDAERIYGRAAVGTPILVHEARLAPDDFVYEPKVPELETPHYLIADIHSNTILAASDFTVSVPIASVTKLMTALIAAEYINLDQSVSVTAPTFVQSLVPRLQDRTRVSMYSLLQLLLVESSNEAAEVIAAQIGRERFIEAMNRKAQSLGMTNSRFVDPSGLGAGNVSSPRDLLRLAQYLHANRSFVLSLTADADLPTLYVSGEFGELINFNEVEGVEGFIGGKVGETLAAGQTSVSLHELTIKGEQRILAVILLGSTERSEDVRTLLKYAKDRFGG
jgi:lipoprotein-anchoring transpeptidase ErfK/SrfK